MAEVRAIDTDPLIRFLTGDVPEKQRRVRVLLDRVRADEIHLVGPVTVIADAVYVLRSPNLYNRPRTDIADMLIALLDIPGFRLDDRNTVRRALQIYGATTLDFGDALLVASMEVAGRSTLYSYDHDFDRIRGITRIEP